MKDSIGGAQRGAGAGPSRSSGSMGSTTWSRGIYFNVAPSQASRPNGVVAGEAWRFCCACIPENSGILLAIQKSWMPWRERSQWKVPGEGGAPHPLPRDMDRGSITTGLDAPWRSPCLLWALTAREISDPSATDAAYLSTFGGAPRWTPSPPGRGHPHHPERVSIPIRQRTAVRADPWGCCPGRGSPRNPAA